MKRYISLLLILPLILAAVAAPASAAEADYGYVNVLEYGYVVDAYKYASPMIKLYQTNNRLTLQGSGTYQVTFQNPGIISGGQFSCLVFTDATFSVFGSKDFTVSDTAFGDDVKLISGSAANGGTYFYDIESYLTFNFQISGGTYLEFINFYVCNAAENTVFVPLEIYDVLHGTTDGATAGATYDYSVNMNDDATNSAGLTNAGQCCIRLRPMATEGAYDFFDLSFEVTGINITSITCMQGDKALEFDVGYTYLDADGNFIVSSDSASGEVASNTYTRYWVSLRVYTPAANFIDGWPLVFIDGVDYSAVSDGQGWNIRFYPTQISYNTSIMDPILYWLVKIARLLNPDGMSGAASEFQQQVDEQSQQLQDMAGIMDSVEKPALDSFDVSVDSYVSQTDVTALAAPMAVFFEGEIFGSVIMMSILLATAGYVLYGKKG